MKKVLKGFVSAPKPVEKKQMTGKTKPKWK
jgi:hypothetical protein